MGTLRLCALLVVAFATLHGVSKPGAVHAHSDTNEPEFVEECLAVFLDPLAFSCQGARVRGALALPGDNRTAAASPLQQPGITTRVLLGAIFQYCTDEGLTRPVRALVPPSTTGSVVAAAAKAITDAFAEFPYRRRPLLTNITQPASLRAYEDEVLRAAADRRSALHAVAASPPAAGGAAGTAISASPAAPYDAIIHTHATMQELRAAQAVTGLAAISGMDQLFERLDIHPALLGLVTYSDELGAVPLDGSQLLLYVRSDVLEAAAAAAGSSSSGGAFRVPDSWEQLLQVAAVTHGLQATQLRVVVNATGGVAYEPTRAPVSGFCFPPSPRVLGDLALAVLASLVQTTGPQQGLYLNTDTLQPATATAAMPYVLSYLRRLAAYAPRAVPSSRAPQFSNDFALGRCAMTIGTAAQFRRNSHAAHPAGPSAVIGRVATALLPGSDVVLSADGQGLVGCTASLCPYSETVSALQPPGSSTSGSSSSAHRRLLATDDGSNATGTGASAQLAAAATSATSSVRVNRSPLLVPEGLAGGLDGEADVMAQLYSWTLLSNFGGPSGSWTLLLHPSAEVGPWRTSHMEAAAVDRWTAAGFEGADTQSFLAAARSCLAHPNNAPPLRIRTALQYTRAVQDAVWTLLDTPPAAAWSAVQEAVHQRGVLQALQDNVGLLYSAATAPVPRTVLLAEYRSSLGLAGSPSGAVYEPEQDSGGQSKSLSAAVAGGIAAAVGTTVLVVLALLVYRVWRRRGLGRRVSSNWRVLEAPSASPDTVLLVTDIEGSTSLWEALPEEVMDRALRVHHITVRTVGRKFYAYESATEGDSFILAFACTANAAQFALELQRALLIAAWPQDLLAVPGCAPVYVRKLDWVAKANQLSLLPAPTRFAGTALPRSSGPGAIAKEPVAAHSGRGRRSSVVLESLAPLGTVGAGGSGQLPRTMTGGLLTAGAEAPTRGAAASAGALSAAALLSDQGLVEPQNSRHMLQQLSSYYSQTGSAHRDVTDSTEPADRDGRNTQERLLQQTSQDLLEHAKRPHGRRAGDKAAATAAADNRDGGSRGASDDGGGGRPQQAERQHADTAARGSNADAAAADAVAPSGLSDVPQLPQLPTTLSLRPSDLALAFNFAPQHRVVSTGGVRPRPAEASAAAAGPSSTLSFADVLLHAPVPVSTLGLQPLVPTRGGATTEPLRKGQHVHFQSLQHQSSGGGDEVGQQATAATALEPGKKMPSFGTPFRAAAAAAAGLVQGRRSSRWLPFLHSGGAKGSHTQPSTPSGHAEPAEAPLALGPSSAPDKQTPAAAGPTRAPPQNGQAGLGALRLARTSASHVEAQRIHNNPAFSTPAGINSASGAVATAAASSSAAVALANRFSALAAELGPGEFSVHGGKRLTQHNSLQLQPQQPRGPVLGVRGWSLPRPASRNRTGAGAAGAAGITANANDGPDITPQHAPQQLLRAFSSKRRAPSPAPRSSNTNDQGVIRASHARFSSFTGLVSNNKEPAAAERQQPSSAPWWSWRPSSNKGAQQPEGAGAATAVAHVASSSEDGGVVRDAGTPRATAALKASSSVRWPLSPFLRRQRQHPPPAGSGIASASGHRTGSVSGQAGATAGSDQQRTSLRQSASMGDERVTPTTAAGPAGTSTYSGAGEDTAAGGSAAANAVDSAPISPVASRMGSFLQMLPTRIQSLTLKLRSQLHLQPHQQPLGQRAARPGGNSMLSRCSSNESDARASAGGGRTSRTSVSRANAVYPALASAAVHEDAFQQHEAGSDGPATAVDVQSLAGLSLGSHVGGSSGAATIRRGPSYGEPRIVMETLVEEATQQLAALMSNAPLAGSGGAADGAAGGATPAAPSGLLADGGTHSVPWGEVGAGGQPGGHSPNSRDEEWQRAEEAAARSAATRRSTREAAAFGIIIGGGPDRVLSLTPGMGALLEAIPDPEHRQPLLPAEDFLMGVSVSLAYHAQQSDTRLEAAGGSAERVLTTVPSAAAAAPKTTALGVPVPGSLLELLWRVFPSLPPGVSPRQDQQQQVAHGVAPSETQLVFAGLRVRVGLHCGVTDARDIQYNAATARMTFGGEGLRIVKAVCDCASGGQVVMSGEVLLRLRAASTASGGMIIPQQGQTHVLDLGDHQLLEAVAAAGGTTASRQGQPQRGGADEAAPVSRQLLSLVPATLLGRLSLMPPVRSAIHQYTPGFMDAPVGDSVTVVVFRVAQASALLAWNAQAAADALTLMEIYLRASLGPLVADGLEPEERRVSAGGATQQPVACYLAAAPPGSPFGTFVAGFSQPAAAARWALTAAGRMAELPWPAELLELQLCRPLEEVTRAEAEAVTDVRGADGAASGAATPLRFVLGRGSRHLGAGSSAAADGTAGNSGSRCKLPRIGGARSVPTSPLFAAASLPPAAAAAGPSASTPAGSRAGGVGSSCDGGTPAGTAAGSSFRSNRSGPLFGRALQRSSSSRITPSHAIGRQHSSRGISATGAPPAALGSGGGGGGLGGSRVAHSRSAFGGSPYLEPAAAAARAPYSRSDIGGMRGQQLPMPSPRAMSIRAAIYEGGESAVELMPLDTMESTVDCEHVFEAVEEPNELHHRHQGSSLSTMHESEPWTSDAPPAYAGSGREPTSSRMPQLQLQPQPQPQQQPQPQPQPQQQQQRHVEHHGRAVTGGGAASLGKNGIGQHVAGLMHARLSAPEPVILPQAAAAAGQSSASRSPTGALTDAQLFAAAARDGGSSALSGTPSGFVRQTSRLAPSASQYFMPGTAAASVSPFAAAPFPSRAGSASTNTAAAFACSSAAAAAANPVTASAGPAVLTLQGSIPEDEITQSLEQLQERLGNRQRSAPVRALAAAASLSAAPGVQRPRPLQEVLTAALGRAPCALASMPSSVHAEITPAADDDGAQAAESTGTMGRLSDAVSCPVAAVTQQRSIPGAETSGALDSMYSGMSGFSRLGTMGRRLDDVTRSHEASGMLRSFAMDDGTVREGAEPAPGSETAGGRGQHPQQRPHPWHTRPRTEHDLPRRASLQQLQPMAPHPRDRPPGSGRGGAHDSKSTVRRLHARMLRTLTTSFSDVGLRRKLAASKSEIAAGAGGSDVGAPFASAVAGESAGGSSSRASGKRLFSPLVSHVAGLASPVYSSSNGGRVGHELTSALMSTGGVAGLDARPFSPPSQGLGSSGANSGFRALQMLVGNRRASQPGGREPSVSGIGAHGSGLIPALATAPSATADAMAAAAARAAEDAEVVSFRGLRVRLGMAVGPVAVQLCPLTGRVVYSGKTVGAAVNVAAAARLGTLYVTQDAAEALSQCGARLVKLPEPEERPRQSKPLLLLPASLTGSPAVSQKPSGTRRRASALSFLLGPRSSVPAVVPLKLAGGASATAAAASQQSTSGAGQQLLRQRTHNTAELERVFLSAAEADAQQQQQQQQRGLGDVPRIAGQQQRAEGSASAQVVQHERAQNSASITASLVPALTVPPVGQVEDSTISAQLAACAVDPQLVCTQVTTSGVQGPLFRCRLADGVTC